MRHVREVLRLRTAGISGNEIARRLNLAPSTVRLTLQRLATAGLSWPLPAELTDGVLEARLFTAVGTKQGQRRHSESDWVEVHRELKRKHVTLQILWDEYIERCPHGYRYSRFCELYRKWASRLSLTVRQTHSGGDKLFVDYAGDTVPVVIDRLNGKTRPAQICGRARRLQLHLCRSKLDAGARRLDRCPHASLCRHRRRAPPAGAGQHQEPALAKAGFAVIEDVDYRTPRGLDRALFQKLAGGEWIDAHDNLILCGPTGVGKSWLACALGHKACRDNRSVLYQRVPKLFADLALARGDGRYARILRGLAGVQLLILDDWGLEPLDAGARHDLYEILEERYGRRSTILTSQIPVDKWHDPT